MAPALLALFYGPDTYPALVFANAYFPDDVKVVFLDSTLSVERNNILLMENVRQCNHSILMVFNCPLCLQVPQRFEVNAYDTQMQPSVRMFVCAQPTQCFPGQANNPSACELLLCTETGILTEDAQRHLFNIFNTVKQSLDFRDLLLV